MSGSMFQLESSNIQNILIALVVICAIVYGYIEFRKVNMRLDVLESKLSKVIQPEIGGLNKENEIQMQSIGVLPEKQGETPGKTSSIMKDSVVNKIINQVENNIIDQDMANQQVVDTFVSIVEKDERITEINEDEDERITEVNEGEDERITEVNEGEDERITEVNEGEEDKGPEDKGPEDKGPEDKGPEDKGPEDKGPEDKESEDKESEDKESEDKEPADKGIISNQYMNISYMTNDTTINTDPELEDNYEEYSITSLKAVLKEKGLATSGNKTSLIKRILSNKK